MRDVAYAPAPGKLKIAIAIATAGRAETLRAGLNNLARQTRRPDAIVVCAPTEADVGELSNHPDVELILGRRGLTLQRNDLLEKLRDHDVLVFFDDDFFPCKDYVETIEAVFAENPDVVLTTGTVVADGILGAGLGEAEALQIIQRSEARAEELVALRDIYSAYGCNMAIRTSTVRSHQIQFDENLPLYGWLEDVDFSRRIAGHGRVVSVSSTCGVHLGVKIGRQSGYRLGYSQIANPIYLVRKGSFGALRAAWLISRNMVMNFVRSAQPEPFIDRKGRLIGNFSAIKDLMAGAMNPKRILSI